jgi:hypothetical protein
MDQSVEIPTDELSQLQLRVARRADELARDGNMGASLGLHCWLLAESELIDGRTRGEDPLTR